jgi:hypothetical protein
MLSPAAYSVPQEVHLRKWEIRRSGFEQDGHSPTSPLHSAHTPEGPLPAVKVMRTTFQTINPLRRLRTAYRANVAVSLLVTYLAFAPHHGHGFPAAWRATNLSCSSRKPAPMN